MTLDISKLYKAYKKYRESVTNPSLPENYRRVDLKHMRFWYPYYAQVVEAIANNKRPRIERRTLTDINKQSQIDYENISNSEIFIELDKAQKSLMNNLLKIPKDAPIPYRKSTKYLPERYLDTLVDHLRMHWEYLDKLTKK